MHSQLEELQLELAHTWGIVSLKLLQNRGYSQIYVAIREREPKECIFKHIHDARDYAQEHQALRFFNGDGCVWELASDAKTRCLLLELARPGHTLASYFEYREPEAASVFCDLISKLHRPNHLSEAVSAADIPTPSIADWLKSAWQSELADSLRGDRDKARDLSESLMASPSAKVFLHGDLHHQNIVFDARRGWLAIDPKGVWGEPLFEAALFVLNPLQALASCPDAASIIKTRVVLLAKQLNAEPERLKNWCYVRAVLGAIWSAEDGAPIDPWLKLMRHLS
jgi:streptomycin 6-kinase